MAQNIKFTVEGGGEFPYDMLRYDACWPVNEADSRRLSSDYFDKRRVTLETSPHTRLTDARWQSFGWQIVERPPGR